ncbi:DNA sulfur modification protein DndD [Desulfobulbus elongatus]|uniref:DNA sulfur modification protein DndD n=1 Tax=Desulfobulbus elongatus TaxID=53332 RepID=UPI0009FD3F3C|nr:DNA sulfur modification protein DndD [Desulfobulbus elongatus]
MWIAEIELTNFKSYISQKFTFPKPTEGKNLILIGGMNGYGKTTLLEALYLCLYGKDAMPHLARAGLDFTKKGRGYPSFLERALNGRALEMRRDNMSVKVGILSGSKEGFSISRRWFFDKQGNWNGEEDTRLIRISPGSYGQTMGEERLPEILDNHFVPAHIAPFFFFDGEEVKKLADQNRIEQIKMGMEGLLGVVLLRGVQKRLERYQNSIRQRNQVIGVDEQKYQELARKLERDERELSGLKAKKEDLDHDLEGDKTRRQDLTGRILALGGGGGDIASAKEIIEEQGRLKVEIGECEKGMEEVLADKLPFHLVHKNFTISLKKQLNQEIARRRWDARKESMAPDKERFVIAFFNTIEPPINPPLENAQEGAVRTRIDAAWESLFYPMPPDCASIILHDYLADEKRETLLQMMADLIIGSEDIRTLIARKESLEHQLNELNKRLTKIEGIDRDGTLAELNKDLIALNATIDQQERSRGDLERQIRALQASIDQDRATYNHMRELIIKASPAKSNIVKAERVHKLIEELVPCLYSLKTRQLGEAMTRAYKSLAHKTQIARIEIDDSGASHLLAGDGEEIRLDRSAGENQLFATALLAGLAEVSGQGAPLVVDTPLARLDSAHRHNILKFWIGRKDRQVILLSQDEEIDAEMFSTFRDSVCKTWLLEHSELGRGIGKTVAKEDRYFTIEKGK